MHVVDELARVLGTLCQWCWDV